MVFCYVKDDDEDDDEDELLSSSDPLNEVYLIDAGNHLL